MGVLILNRDRKFLIGKRGPACKRGAGCWALPGGMIDADEDVVSALIREVFEETGLTVVPAPVGIGQPPFVTIQPFAITDHVGFKGEATARPDSPYGYQPENHLSLWFVARLLEHGFDIGSPLREQVPVVREPEKCLEWKWVTMADVEDIPGVRDKQTEQYYWLPMDVFEATLKGLFK